MYWRDTLSQGLGHHRKTHSDRSLLQLHPFIFSCCLYGLHSSPLTAFFCVCGCTTLICAFSWIGQEGHGMRRCAWGARLKEKWYEEGRVRVARGNTAEEKEWGEGGKEIRWDEDRVWIQFPSSLICFLAHMQTQEEHRKNEGTYKQDTDMLQVYFKYFT